MLVALHSRAEIVRIGLVYANAVGTANSSNWLPAIRW